MRFKILATNSRPKVTKKDITVTRDDVDYLSRRALQCIVKSRQTTDPKERKRLRDLAIVYQGYWKANKDKVKHGK
jgi:hypothetical protein